jgi:hypothetical protein
MLADFEEFQKNWPDLYKNVYCGFCSPKEWSEIIKALSRTIAFHNESLPPGDRTTCAQVKEKFGGLRYYVDNSNDYVEGAVAMAEEMVALLERERELNG